MYNMMDANMSWMSIIYFCLLVILGAFFLLQVILAIIMDAFDEVDKKQSEEKLKKDAEIRKAVQWQRDREEYLSKKEFLGSIKEVVPLPLAKHNVSKEPDEMDQTKKEDDLCSNSERPMIDAETANP